MISIVNRQRHRKIDKLKWQSFTQKALTEIGAGQRDATIVFLSDEAMRRLNRQFRGRDYATDVLSFRRSVEPFEQQKRSELGEIVISIQRAVLQARSNDLSLDHEVKQLILHGLLHLCGHDHETDDGEMNRLELRLRRRLKI